LPLGFLNSRGTTQEDVRRSLENLVPRNRKGEIMNRKAFATCSGFSLASLFLVCHPGIASSGRYPESRGALGVLTLRVACP
jgi:hypothetical protein